jgi:hypothetical protein
MNVYVVTRGWYEDKRIVAIFSAREKAESFVAAVNFATAEPDDTYDVEEYPVDAIEAGLKAMEEQ